MIDSELLPRVAKKIKALRSNKNLTLAELSKQSNVSKGLLSKIENSRTIPSLPVFLGIVNALGVTLKDFFEGMDLLRGREYLLIKKNDRQPIQKEEREGFSYWFIMTQHLPGSSMQLVLLQVAPGARSTPSTTDGHELKYILAGHCDYYINEEIVRLEEGDALYFDGSKPHMPVNRGINPVVMLVIYFLK
ncbi:MAG TPA: XRE family transcriptional regulator [Cyclobacteriaceae bacterium]